MIKPKRHPDRLVPSDPDMISLCAAVVDNYNMLVKSYERIKKEPLLISSEMEPVRQRVAVLVARYEKDDFRHSESEKKALRRFADWTLEINHSIRGQEGPVPIIGWVD